MQPSNVDPEEIEVIEGLVQLSAVVQGTLVRVAEDQGLTPTQARMLMVLTDREPTMRVLAHIMGLEKSSLTGLVDRAEGRGLVERFTTKESRRSVRVRLTAEGRHRCAAYTKVVRPEMLRLLESLSAADKTQWGAQNQRIVDDYVRVHAIDVTTLGPPPRFV